MKQFLRQHRFDILFLTVCVLDVVAMSKFPALCEALTGVMLVCMVIDHRRQEAQMGQKDMEGH